MIGVSTSTTAGTPPGERTNITYLPKPATSEMTCSHYTLSDSYTNVSVPIYLNVLSYTP